MLKRKLIFIITIIISIFFIYGCYNQNNLYEGKFWTNEVADLLYKYLEDKKLN